MVLIKNKFSKKYIRPDLRSNYVGFNINSMQDLYKLENKQKRNNMIKFNINSIQDWYNLEKNNY